MDDLGSPELFFVLAGLIGGIVLFARGLIAYRHDRLISSVATSSLDGIAAGEVRVTGTIEAIDHTLISPLQSKPCVWYRSRVEETGEHGRVLLDEEKAQDFRISDDSGEIRVVPRGVRWEIGNVFDESTSITGGEPTGLQRRTGSTYAALETDPDEMTEVEKQAAVQALLTVQQPAGSALTEGWGGADTSWSVGIGIGTSSGRRYREARLEPGHVVTVLGQALPWADVREVLHTWDPSSNIEATIAEDVATAREMGILAASPEEAWGNAAIPGFGIGQPTLQPDLHPQAHRPEPLGEEAHDEALARYDIPDEELVLSRGQRGELAIYAGAPRTATMHHDFAFVLGVLGAIMAVVCALGMGAIVTGTL